jgi:hypothetical protein
MCFICTVIPQNNGPQKNQNKAPNNQREENKKMSPQANESIAVLNFRLINKSFPNNTNFY